MKLMGNTHSEPQEPKWWAAGEEGGRRPVLGVKEVQPGEKGALGGQPEGGGERARIGCYLGKERSQQWDSMYKGPGKGACLLSRSSQAASMLSSP